MHKGEEPSHKKTEKINLLIQIMYYIGKKLTAAWSAELHSREEVMTKVETTMEEFFSV